MLGNRTGVHCPLRKCPLHKRAFVEFLNQYSANHGAGAEKQLHNFNTIASHVPLPNLINNTVQNHPQFDRGIPDQFPQAANANNRIASLDATVSGSNYDSAGNLTSDGTGGSYAYRADGLITGSNGWTYTYDPLGQRVRKDGSSSNEYIYFGGQLLAMRNPSTGAWTDRIYGLTGALAMVPGIQSGAAVYRATDHLGSLSYALDASGNITGASSVLPYGQSTTNSTGDAFTFTDHERDSENGADATLYRHYASWQGRWLSPDPSNASYNLLDPQSLNRYSYLTNRPMAKVDRLGLDDDDDDDSGSWWDNFWGDIFGSDSSDGGSSQPSYGVPSVASDGISGTSEPNGGYQYIDATLFYNGSTGVATGAWQLVDVSPGLDQDGMADFPLAQALFHGGGAPYLIGANTVAGTAKGVGTFYAASAVGAAAVLTAPAATSWAVNTSGLLGPSARLFWSGTGASQQLRPHESQEVWPQL